MNTFLKLVRPVLASAAVMGAALAATGAAAQQTMDHSKMDHGHMDHVKMASTKGEQATDVTEGEVRKVNLDTGKVTIQHGDIRNLGMPAMTMAFPVKTASLLDNLEAGDKIKFKVLKENGKLVITELQKNK